MDIIDSPFLKLSPKDMPRPWLPIILKNPHTNKTLGTFGLIDTGSDECAIPAAYASFLGHNLRAVKPKRVNTGKGETSAYPHTLCIETKGIEIENVLVDFMPNLKVVLLGTKTFLSKFEVIIDYKKFVFSLKQE
jgi:hypothetical protein